MTPSNFAACIRAPLGAFGLVQVGAFQCIQLIRNFHGIALTQPRWSAPWTGQNAALAGKGKGPPMKHGGFQPKGGWPPKGDPKGGPKGGPPGGAAV